MIYSITGPFTELKVSFRIFLFLSAVGRITHPRRGLHEQCSGSECGEVKKLSFVKVVVLTLTFMSMM